MASSVIVQSDGTDVASEAAVILRRLGLYRIANWTARTPWPLLIRTGMPGAPRVRQEDELAGASAEVAEAHHLRGE